ncbi:MAG: ATP-binding protein [Thermotogota bacterium]
MIEYLDMHLLDLFQNALASGASEIDVSIDEGTDDFLRLVVRDNGFGMDEETLAAVDRGFYSSKSAKRVGLGIPLLRAVAEHCEGSFRIESASGRGTTVSASFRSDHIDLPPFDDLGETFLAMLVASTGPRVRIHCHLGGKDIDVDTAELAETLGDVPITHPGVIGFLRNYLRERLEPASRSAG